MGNPARVLFLLLAAFAAAIVWLAPHPPMIDLPQHAGQLALLQQMWAGDGRWTQLFQINWYTPYLIGFGLALPLSLLMPIAAALKLLLSLAYLAFVAVCVALRRRFGGDPRLDWLFLPSFFGFAFHWGFFTFLTAAPLGLLLVLLADRHGQAPSARRGWPLAAVGLVLLVSHGLVFLFAMALAAALIVVPRHVGRPGRSRLLALWPLLAPGLALVAYYYARNSAEAAFAIAPTVPSVMPQLGFRHEVIAYALGLRWTPLFAVAAAVFFAAPWLLGLRLDPRSRSVLPLAVVGAVLAVVPSFMFETSFVYQRFALFLFPAYAWAFAAPAAARTPPGPSGRAAVPALALAAASVLGLHGWHSWQFGREAADFDRVSQGLEPGQKALALVYDTDSPAAANFGAYVHYAAWYQVEQLGLVDFNFAWVPPQIVRYRVATRPPVAMDFAWRPQKFEWLRHRGNDYRYFFVRRSDALPAATFAAAPCPPTLLRQSGSWSVYERSACVAQN